MVHFEKCITDLLNRLGQVQVPGLGRFEYVEVSSVVKQMGSVITPPLSTLVFCNECKSDGQDFINFFAQTEKCDLFNATTEVTSCVNRIKNDLKQNGSFYLDKLGTLMMSQNQIFFLPEEATHFNENLFGLTDVTFSKLSANFTFIPRSKQMKAPTLAKQSIKERQHKKMPTIRRTATYAAATVTAFVFLLSTLFFGNMQKQNEASVLDVYTSSNNGIKKNGQDVPVITQRTLKNDASEQKMTTSFKTNQTTALNNAKAEAAQTKVHTDADVNQTVHSNANTSHANAKVDVALQASAKPDVKAVADIKNSAQNNAAKPNAQAITAKPNAQANAVKANPQATVAAKQSIQTVAAKQNIQTVAAKSKVQDAAVKPNVQAPAAKPNVQANANVSKPYTIVLASAVSEKNATDYIERLKKEGYNDVRMMKKGNMNRVVFSRFNSDTDARNQLATLRSKSNEFAAAWIYKIP